MPAALGLPVTVLRADFSADIARKRRYIEAHWEADGVPPDRVARALELLHPTGIAMLDLCMIKGRFPSRMAQFCTSELKIKVAERYMAELRASTTAPLESWQGIRRDESANRRDALAVEHVPEERLTIVRPIVEWTAQQVVDFIVARGMPLNPLYAQGCNRVGCMLCINASKDEIANAARRWPHHIARLREWERLVSETSKRGFTTFFTDSADENETNAETCARLCIDKRVEWATTSWGGRQQDMFRQLGSVGCASSYGLCE
jgi:hypothetical protein